MNPTHSDIRHGSVPAKRRSRDSRAAPGKKRQRPQSAARTVGETTDPRSPRRIPASDRTGPGLFAVAQSFLPRVQVQHRLFATGMDSPATHRPGQAADPAHRPESHANQPRMRLLRPGSLLPHVHPQRGHQSVCVALPGRTRPPHITCLRAAPGSSSTEFNRCDKRRIARRQKYEEYAPEVRSRRIHTGATR